MCQVNSVLICMQGPEYIWVDDSDQSGQILHNIFPSVKVVLEDSTHLMRRYMRTLTPGQPLNRAFPGPSCMQHPFTENSS